VRACARDVRLRREPPPLYQSSPNFVQRKAGSMLRTLSNAGTIAAGNLVVCDATGTTGSWKQLTDPSKTY
jgi:hypothetical protein